MNISAPFIARPVATTLLAVGVAMAGLLGFLQLPVAPLPQVDFPTISVQAQLSGAEPETVATSVAGPLERHLGRIANVTEMTSSSGLGQTRITLQFDLERNIDGAAREVQAAINAARSELPTSLRSNPTYNKVNPGDAPILILALTSSTLTPGQIYDRASNILQQRLSQLEGIGQVSIGGGSLPAVRVELNPHALFKYGIGLETVRAALASANANSPKGMVEEEERRFQIYSNDQANVAEDYRPIVVAYRNGAPVRLSDVAEVVDSVEDLRATGLANGKPAVIVRLYRLPGANIIGTIDRARAELPWLRAAMAGDIDVMVVFDRSPTIRSSLHDTEITLVVAVVLVTLIVFLFLRDLRATLIASIAAPISIIGTFAGMYLAGFSLNHLSLMALTIATGFVVDDAIVVLENIARHREAGASPVEAALRGAKEVGFTVVSISLSLIAVFIPILLMGGIVGRLFREFALTLSLAILVSLVLSLTLTPMLCARFLRPQTRRAPSRFDLWQSFSGLYGKSLDIALRHSGLVLSGLVATIGLNVYLFAIVPKGFFPQQDTGRIIGNIQADQSISFQLMKQKLEQIQSIVLADPAVESVVGYTGSGTQTNTGSVFIGLKPLHERKENVEAVIGRLRRQAANVPGARLFMFAGQDIRLGGRPSNATYQFSLQGDNTAELYREVPRLVEALRDSSIVADVNSDQQQKGLETRIVIDRDAAYRLGLSLSQINNTLYDAFGQRRVSVIYSSINQYSVIMEVAPRFWQDPSVLDQIYISTSGGNPRATAQSNARSGTVAGDTSARETAAELADDPARNAALNALAASGRGGASAAPSVSTAHETMVPLSAFARFEPGNAPLGVNHQGLFVVSTISFNLQPGASLGDAIAEIRQKMAEINMPASIQGSVQGTAKAFEESQANQQFLVLAAIATVYIVLGILYESYIHPVTILSTLPSAGVGAVLALLLFGTELSIVAMIAVILLVGIVKKNAIMMIDFAIQAERGGLSPEEAIRRACLLRLRPILMTTFAAIFGAIPLAVGFGEGAELRQPLGIAIVGGLIVSQILTLYTTPVLYLRLDRLRIWSLRLWRRRFPAPAGELPSTMSGVDRRS
jgi:multidrug efflux pump